jgi:molybdopterin-guanine dinucleotide biosynthesis protein A
MGETKALLPFHDDRTMIDHVAAAMGAVCTRLVILGDVAILPDLPHVADLRADRGPLGGIEALLASGIDSAYLVCACDTPLLTGDLLRRLVTAPAATATIFESSAADGRHPLPMRITADALPAVRAMLDENRGALHRLADALDAQRLPVDARAERELTGVNTPEEYRQLLARGGQSEPRP